MGPRQAGRGVGPRHHLLDGRGDALTDASVLGIVVGEDSAAVSILQERTLPDVLWDVSAEDLMVHEGIGPAAAARVLACLELSRRASSWSGRERPTVSTPEDVVRLCAAQLRGSDRERFWALALNTKNGLLRTIEVSVGSLNASIVHPRELFKDAIRVSAASIVVVHNHPSGDPTPSGADLSLTRRLVKAGDVLGIDVLDHVIIGGGGTHVSMRDIGLM